MFLSSIWEPTGTLKAGKSMGGSFKNEVSAMRADAHSEPQTWRHFQTVSHISRDLKGEKALIVRGSDFK